MIFPYEKLFPANGRYSRHRALPCREVRGRLDGVSIDFENVPRKSRHDLETFMDELFATLTTDEMTRLAEIIGKLKKENMGMRS